MDLHKFEGNVYFSLIRNGIPTGLIGPIECDSFQPGRSTEEGEETRSKKRDIYDQVIDAEPGTATGSLTMVFKEQPAELLGLMFAADPEALDVSAGNVVAGEVVIGKVGAFKLGHRNISDTPPIVVTDDDTDTPTTYTVGDDYTIDPRIGLLRIVPGGAIATDLATAQVSNPDATLTLLVSYSYEDLEALEFYGETVPKASLAVLFDGKNRKSGKDFQMEYYQVDVQAPDEIMDLLTSTLITTTLTGTPITPPGKRAPYRVIKL